MTVKEKVQKAHTATNECYYLNDMSVSKQGIQGVEDYVNENLMVMRFCGLEW